MKRRVTSITLVVTLLATIGACAAPEAEPATAPELAPGPAPKAVDMETEITIEFFSVAQPRTDGEKAVIFITELFRDSHPKIYATWKWLPLPAAVGMVDEMPPDVRKHGFVAFLPVTDLFLARAGAGPAQHGYERAHTDLMFVGNVTNGGWTFLTRDPELAANPRKLADKTVGVVSPLESPHWGSPDLLSQAILRDAWGIFDEVDQIKVGLLEMGGIFEAGIIDACFWGMANHMCGTFTIPSPFHEAFRATQHYWLPLTQEDVDKINAANTWKISLLTVPKGSIALPGAPPATVNPPEDVTMCDFSGAMTAWVDTEDDLVYEMLRFIVENADRIREANVRIQPDPKKMAQWPGLTRDMVHPGALRFYSDLGIKIGE